MRCDQCGAAMEEADACRQGARVLCEDCYIQAVSPLRTCDVAAVHGARTHREQSGHQGVEGLLEIQRRIVELVRARGRATKPELAEALGVGLPEIERQCAILRHCELVKGRKIDEVIYLLPFEAE